MRADAVAPDDAEEVGPRVLQKTTKAGHVTSYGPGFARSSKSCGREERGREGRSETKAKATLKLGEP